MHAELPAAAVHALDVDRVVEIAGVIGIDRDDELRAQILAAGGERRFDGFRNLFRLLDDGAGKLERKMILPNDRKHVDAGISALAEHFDDLAFRIDVARFPRFQPNDYFVAHARLRRLHVNVVDDARIVRHDVEEIPGLLHGADDGVVGPLQDSDDAAFRSCAAAFGPRISVHRA